MIEASSGALAALLQVLMIDLVLAGDNAVAVGLAAAGLPAEQRRKVIALGLAAAVVMRIGFALVTTQLLQVIGLLFGGGLLLLWVCWKMWRELRNRKGQHAAAEILAHADAAAKGGRRKTFREAALQIVVADVSMSLDNVLAVAGAAREHPWVLVFGLVLSIGLMGLAASLVARLLDRWRWIAWIGLTLVLYIALRMTYHGWLELRPMLSA